MPRQAHDGVYAHAFVGQCGDEFPSEAMTGTAFQSDLLEQPTEEARNAIRRKSAHGILLRGKQALLGTDDPDILQIRGKLF